MNYIYFYFIILCIIFSFSSNNWFLIWVMMEISLISFIPIIKNNTLFNSSALMIYFLIQSLSSILFLLSMIFNYMKSYNQITSLLILLTILLKIGFPPFHSWMIQMSNGLTLIHLFFMITLMKIIPFYFLSFFHFYLLQMMILFSIFLSTILGLNQTLIPKIIIFSSISHMNWMLSIMMYYYFSWIPYFLIYTLITFMLIKSMLLLKWNSINSPIFINNSKTINFQMMVNLMSLAGMPPFLGFFPKWMSIMLLSSSMSMILLALLISSLINIYIYLRITFSILLNMSMKIKWENNNIMISNLFMINLMSIFLLIPLI
uniref:NADH-ubiquinone oxidoreductase chain 2 n=1 Tax=Nuttalliella namaqua TaxID=1029659 RepID=A0A1P8AGH1_9ACAR|nr:NADH dehydrogenase subunit 2 [Nuttalliella namaqua]UYB78171.1 NADH dehydrogenase subunit 2 [Nuttalliella namaqua]